MVTGARADDAIYAGTWLESQNRLFVVYGGPIGTDVTVEADRRWEVWDTNAFTCRAIPSEHSAGLRDVKVSPDGKTVAIASRDGTASLWDWQSANRLRVLDVKQGSAHSNIVSSVAFHPSLPVLMTVSFDNRIVFWDLPTGSLLAELNVDPTGSKGYGINGLLKEAVFSPDGNSVFACVGGEQWVIDLHFYDSAVEAMDAERRGK
jgi:WD40 repeat protein